MVPGVTYQITAWVKFAAGRGNGAIWLSMQRVNGGASSFDTVAQTPGVTDGAWSRVSARYLMASADTAFLYFETTWPDGTSASFLVDDVVVTALDDPDIEDLTPIKDTVDFNMGVAVDSRETAGSAAALRPPALRPADAGEPHEAGGLVRRRPRVRDPSRSDRDHGLRAGERPRRLRAHARLAQPDAGVVLHPRRRDAADERPRRPAAPPRPPSLARLLGRREAEHGVRPVRQRDEPARRLRRRQRGGLGCEHRADGLRRSRWYDVLGESYIDLAFRYADEAFNETYAVPGPTARPAGRQRLQHRAGGQAAAAARHSSAA